mgnify:CR=1 FL=1
MLNSPDAGVSARRNLFLFIAIMIAIFLVLLIAYLWLEHAVQSPRNPDSAPARKIIIESGSGVAEIAELLQREQIISGTLPFKYYVWKTGKKKDFKAGTYEISPSQNIVEITDLLSGVMSGEVRVTIVEGWTNRAIRATLGEKLTASADNQAVSLAQRESTERDFDDAVLATYEYEWLRDVPPEQKLEGYLFPDTYRFFREAPMTEVIEKMLRNFDQKMTDERRVKIAASGWTINQVITLASIVQKEAVEADMPRVAGIFLQRLAENKKLESDATVNYVTGKGERQPSIEDTRLDSPYNTYRSLGLPPGPICNPGLAAIDAVLNPERTDYFYFLNAPDGRTIYSRTYEEHLDNKEKYLDQAEESD